MKAESYTQAVQHAWKLTWTRKRLWVLGLLAALVGSGGSFEFVFNYFSALGGREDPLSEIITLFVSTFTGGPDVLWASLFAIFVMFVVLAVIVLIAISGQGSLIYAVSQAEKSSSKLNLSRLMQKGKNHLWPLFGVNFVKLILIAILLYGTRLMVALLAGSTSAFASVLMVALSIIILLLGLTVSFLAIYSACFIMLHEKSFKESVVQSWALFANHWLVSLEMAVVVFLVGLLMGIVGVGGLMAIATPAFLGVAIGAISGSSGFAGVALVSSIIAGALWLILVASVYTTFAISAWTVLFIQMKERGLSSKMKAFLKNVLKR